MKTKVGCVLMIALFCGFEIDHQTGAVHATRKNGIGCLCHGFNPTSSVRVWISGPESLGVGRQGLYRVNVASEGTIAAGFNVAALHGSLGVADTAGTILERESSTDSLELTHTVTRLRSSRDTLFWDFYYKAPLTANITDTIYAAGNAVNNDTLPDGDYWNYSPNFRVRVHPLTAVDGKSMARSYRLLQNYPNPFNPSTTIRYEIPIDARVRLSLFDISGRELMTVVDQFQPAGIHEAVIDSESAALASGVYLFRLFVTSADESRRQFMDVKKLVVLR